MAKTILIRPVITEKSERLSESESGNQYTFIVNRKANKIEIKNAVEADYQVSVKRVNTAIMPAKAKSRFTRAGQLKGRVPAYKKAMITLIPGDEIDFFGEL